MLVCGLFSVTCCVEVDAGLVQQLDKAFVILFEVVHLPIAADKEFAYHLYAALNFRFCCF